MMIEKKKKLCVACEKDQYIWKNYKGDKYCQQCWYKHKDNPIKNIKKVSAKKQSLDNEYSQLRRIFLTKNPKCQMHIPGICQNDATDVHHMSGRLCDYLKIETWKPACRACHCWTEEHPEEARDLGFSNTKY